MAHEPQVSSVYDKPVDVLHLVLGEPQSYEGDGLYRGLEIDYALDTGEPCGAKIIGFRRYGWPDRLIELAEVLADKLFVRDAKIILEAISNVGK